MGKGAFPALLHCFTASRALAEMAVGLGLYISFSGVVTFKNSAELRAIARDTPMERILVETDAPFLAPVPHRGKRNEPAFVADTARASRRGQGRLGGGVRPRDDRQRAAAVLENAAARSKGAGGVSLAVTILGCGSSGGVPRVGQGWGKCDPEQSEEPAPALFDPARARPARRRDQCVDRHLARSARAIDRRRCEAARRHSLHPSARRPHPWRRRFSRAGHHERPAHPGLYGRAHGAGASPKSSTMFSRRRRAAFIRRC